MNNESDNIELRSEKARNIIGQIPPRLIRSGSTIIFIIVMVLLFGSYWFKYPYIIKSQVLFKKNDSKIIGIIEIDADEIDKIEVGQKAVINFSNVSNMNNDYLVSKIDSISSELILESKRAYFYVYTLPYDTLKTVNNRAIVFNNKIIGNVKIKTKEISFFDRIIKPLKSILISKKSK